MDYRLIILAIFSLSKFESFIFNRILVFLVFKTKVTIGILRFSGKKFVKMKIVFFSVLFIFQKLFFFSQKPKIQNYEKSKFDGEIETEFDDENRNRI